MPRRTPLGPVASILAAILLTTACSAGGPTPSALASAVATVTPLASVTPGAPTPPAASSTEPPPASLAAEGGDQVVGQLGSYTWGGGGSDSPWLPGTTMAVGTGERLTVILAGGLVPADWSARRVPAGTADGSGAVRIGGGPAPVTFVATGPGSWSVQVLVRFADGLGSAAYYWQLTVR